MKARKRFGQHFLTDQGVLGRIVSACNIGDDDTVFEIGPGHGALTEHLVAAEPNKYFAVEIDRDLVPLLQAKFPRVDVINKDILRVDLDDITREFGGDLRVVGNLPYNISTPLLLKLAHWSRTSPGCMRDGVFMVQRELGERLAAVPGSKSWGRLSVMTQLAFNIEYLFDVSPDSFSPPPKVWSSIIRLMPSQEWAHLTSQQLAAVDRVCRFSFAGRRKKLSNSLKPLEIDWSKEKIDPMVRADDVSIEEFVSLARYVTNESPE